MAIHAVHPLQVKVRFSVAEKPLAASHGAPVESDYQLPLYVIRIIFLLKSV